MPPDPDYIAALDLRLAYDHVDRHKLLELCEERLPPHLTAMITPSLRELTVTTAGDLSQATGKIRLGVPQGSPLSPILFNLFTDTLAYELSGKLCSALDPPRGCFLLTMSCYNCSPRPSFVMLYKYVRPGLMLLA